MSVYLDIPMILHLHGTTESIGSEGQF